MRGMRHYWDRSALFVPVVAVCAILFITLGVAVGLLHGRIRSLEEHLANASASRRNADDRIAPGDDPGREKASDRGIFEATVAGIGELLQERNADRARELLNELTSSEGELSLTRKTGPWSRPGGNFRVSLTSGNQRFFHVDARPDRGVVEIKSILDESYLVEQSGADGAAGVEFVHDETERIERILETHRRFRRQLERLPLRPAVSRLLEERGMKPTRIVEDDFLLRWGLANEDGAIVVRIAADPEAREYRVDGRSVGTDMPQLESAVAEAIGDYDPREALARTLERLEGRLVRLLEDRGFRRFLDERGLEIQDHPDAESNVSEGRTRVVYALLLEQEGEGSGAVLARLVLDADSGAIELVEAEGDGIWTLDRVAVTHAATDHTATGDAATGDHPGFLLFGTHDGLADSIIYVRPTEAQISAISIPRDIYYDGQKLNEVNATGGPLATATAVEELLGVEVDHYVSADFEAFERVVDALDTIPIELEKEFLDPGMSYEVDGEERMLYFPPGSHKIDGSTALALARSRRTTSDFSRARRQQLILAGIRRRIDQLALTDADHLFRLVNVAVQYTETDLGFLDALTYYRRYRDSGDLRRLVLSTDNVFHSTYSELHEDGLPVERAEELEQDEIGQWILRPKNESWASVRAFVEEWLSGGDPSVDEIFGTEGDTGAEVDLSLLEELTSQMPR